MIDGATYWQRVRQIIVPLTARTILLATLISAIGSMLAFDQFYIMTARRTAQQTFTSVFWIYLNSFLYLKLGYGAALSLILCVIILALPPCRSSLTRRGARGHDRRRSCRRRCPARATGRNRRRQPRCALPRRGDLHRAHRDDALPLLASVFASLKTQVEAPRSRRPTSRTRSASRTTASSSTSRPACRPISSTA